jgi:hypothetical protein
VRSRRVWDWYREDFIEVPAPKAPQRLAAELHGVRPDLPGTFDEVGAVISPQYAPEVAPQPSGAFLCRHWRRILMGVALLAGGVAELGIIWVAYELVDLCLSLMEVWTQLARKHLEITL